MIQEKYHTFWNRFLAVIIDGFVLWPIDWIDEHVLSGSIDALGIMAWGVFYSLIGVFYYVAMHAKYGQTIGKMIAKVKVLDISEERLLTIRQACMRDLIPILCIPFSIYVYFQFAFYGQSEEITLNENPWYLYFGVILFAWTLLELLSMLFNDKRRAVHDFIAGSVVIKTDSLTQQSNAYSVSSYKPLIKSS